jgi:hypothetical protein
MKSSIRRFAAHAIAASSVLVCNFNAMTLALASTPISFRDISNDIYAKEIQEAVKRGFIAGFPADNTFRPQLDLTREQLVSIVIDALSKLPVSSSTVPSDPPSASFPEVTKRPYRDVVVTRWSAAKINWARDNKLIFGYKDGSFRPTQRVNRAELLAVLRRAAEYGAVTQGSGLELLPQQPPIAFSDTSNHWANSLIAKMSSYCGVASPLNETGNAFSPDSAARRNYAAAATLRMLKCVNGETRP